MSKKMGKKANARDTTILMEEVGVLRGLSVISQSPRDIARGGHLSEDMTGQRLGGILRRFVKAGWAARLDDNTFVITVEGKRVKDLVHAAYGDYDW